MSVDCFNLTSLSYQVRLLVQKAQVCFEPQVSEIEPAITSTWVYVLLLAEVCPVDRSFLLAWNLFLMDGQVSTSPGGTTIGTVCPVKWIVSRYIDYTSTIIQIWL